MPDEQEDLRPPWWQVQGRHAAREARRDARDERRRVERTERAAGRAVKRGSAAGPTHAPVTPEGIADAAIAVIDREGLAGLTVRALAQELGLGTMTLYWYVRNKEEVLDLVGDRMLAGIEMPPEEGDWREQCRQSMIAVRKAFLAHPRAMPIMVGRGSFGPNGLRWLEYALGVFRRAGFTDKDAADAYFTASNYVAGFCTQETAGADPTSDVNADRAGFAAKARQYISLLPPDRYPNVTALSGLVFTGNRDDRFAFGVDALIAGFQARLEVGHAQR